MAALVAAWDASDLVQFITAGDGLVRDLELGRLLQVGADDEPGSAGGDRGDASFEEGVSRVLFDAPVHAVPRGKGWLSAFRDATLFKVAYAWGLRRREAAMLDVAKWR